MASRKTAKLAPEQALKDRVLQDAKDVGKWAALLYGLFSLFLLGTQAAVVKLLSKPGELTDEAIGFYVSVFQHAAPFTLGLTIIGVAWTWFLRTENLDQGGNFFAMSMLTALVLAVSMAIGNNLGLGDKVPVVEIVGNWPMGTGVIVNMIYSYYKAYHGTLFFSSIAVATLLTVVWIVKVEPLIKAWVELDKQQAPPAA